MKNNKLLILLKETDPDFKNFLEEKITINRENFQNALASVYGLGRIVKLVILSSLQKYQQICGIY